MHVVLPLLRSLVMLNIYLTDDSLGFFPLRKDEAETRRFCLLSMSLRKAQRAPGLVKHIAKVMGMVEPLRKCLLSCLIFLSGYLEIDPLNSQQNYEMRNGTIGHFEDVPSAIYKAQKSLKLLLALGIAS